MSNVTLGGCVHSCIWLQSYGGTCTWYYYLLFYLVLPTCSTGTVVQRIPVVSSL